jgi:prolipoprotein diacylglyceryltransferase
LRSRDQRLFSAALILALAAVLVGRTVYVVIHWEYYSEHPAETVALSGLSEHGAIVGGGVAYLILRRAVRPPLAELESLCLMALVLVTVAASLGCIEVGCAYGREVFWQTDGEASLAWQLRVDWPDAYQVRNPRWPTQIFMSFWMMGCGLICRLTRLHFPSIMILGFGLGDFIIQFLRGDPAFLLGPFRIYQWFDLVFIALSLLWFMFGLKRVTLTPRSPCDARANCCSRLRRLS